LNGERLAARGLYSIISEVAEVLRQEASANGNDALAGVKSDESARVY